MQREIDVYSFDIPEDPIYRAKGCVEATSRFTNVDINVILSKPGGANCTSKYIVCEINELEFVLVHVERLDL